MRAREGTAISGCGGWLIVAVLAAVLAACGAPHSRAAPPSTEEIAIGVRRIVPSRVLNEPRTIYVHLPESYAESHGYRRYPVLYLRDGGKFFHSFTGGLQQLSSDATPRAPEMIVVAIVETDRVRDSSSTHSLTGFTGKEDPGYRTSGGGAQFMTFVEQELIPYIDRTFSTSGYRIYCGYSFTGLSALDAFYDDKGVFDAFLVLDPSWWWDGYAPARRAAHALAGRKAGSAGHTQLFLAASGEPYPEKYFPRATDVSALDELLRSTNPPGLSWQFVRYTDETHHSLPLRALYDGVSYIFRGYQPSLHELYVEPEKLAARYDALAARLGERFSLSDGLLTFFGSQFLDQFHDPDRALLYFQTAAAAFPGSSAAWEGVGDALRAKGDRAGATRAYERSLAQRPRSESAETKLQALRGP